MMAEVELSSSFAIMATFAFFFAFVNAMMKPNLYPPSMLPAEVCRTNP
jgi:hypothetical protein